jgi:CMP/dCMP kinase
MVADDFNSIITVDGASGTGKTTLLRGLAERFDCTLLELGPLVRVAAWLSSRDRATTTDAIARLDSLRERGTLRIDRNAAGVLSATEVELDGLLPRQDSFSAALRDATTAVSSDPEAMSWVYALVRATLRGRRAVLSARDGAGSVCPEAPLRIWLEASPVVRGRRKRDQMIVAGLGARWVDDAVLLELPRRTDLILDTTLMTRSDVLAQVSSAIERRLGWRPHAREAALTDLCGRLPASRLRAQQTA